MMHQSWTFIIQHGAGDTYNVVFITAVFSKFFVEVYTLYHIKGNF